MKETNINPKALVQTCTDCGTTDFTSDMTLINGAYYCSEHALNYPELVLNMPDLSVEWLENDSPFGDFSTHVLQ